MPIFKSLKNKTIKINDNYGLNIINESKLQKSQQNNDYHNNNVSKLDRLRLT